MADQILRLAVMLGFKDGAAAADIDELVRRFHALQEEVPGIEAFEWGVNNSPEDLASGLTHFFLLDFASEAARDAYLPHPKHADFAEWTGQFVEKVTVLDYWARKTP